MASFIGIHVSDKKKIKIVLSACKAGEKEVS